MNSTSDNEISSKLPSSPKACAAVIVKHVYELDSFKRLQPILKANTANK